MRTLVAILAALPLVALAQTPTAQPAPPQPAPAHQGRILGLGAGAGSGLDGTDGLNHRDVNRYVAEVQGGRWPVACDAPITEKQARERLVLFRILFTNRSLTGFKALLQQRFEEFFAEPLGSHFDQVVQDMIRHGYVQLVDERIVFTDRLWEALADLRFGTPSLV